MTQDPSGGGPKRQFGSSTSLGISIGAGAGVALGLVVGSLALGIAIGVALGAAIGAMLDRRKGGTVDAGQRPEAESEAGNPRWLWWLAAVGIILFLVISGLALLSIIQST